MKCGDISKMNYTEAVEGAKKGKENAFSFLYQQTYKKNYYVALKYLRNETLVEDVLQDSYVAAFKSLEKLEDPEKFSAWMARIVANRALNELKKDKPLLFSETENEDGQDITETFEDDRANIQPEVAMDQQETSRLMQEIIDQLSEEQRVCITMFYMQEMSVKEMAEILQVSENTVKSRLNYGRQKIRDKVLDLEKKGTKLYSLAPIPFFLLLFREDVSASPIPIPEWSWAGKSVNKGITKRVVAAAKTTKIVRVAITFFIVVSVIGVGETVYHFNSQRNQKQEEKVKEYSENEKETQDDIALNESQNETQTEMEMQTADNEWIGTSSADGLFQPHNAFQYNDMVFFLQNSDMCIFKYNLATGELDEQFNNGARQFGYEDHLNVYEDKIYFTNWKMGNADEDGEQICCCNLDASDFQVLGYGTECLVADDKIYYRNVEPGLGSNGESLKWHWREQGAYMVMNLDGTDAHPLETEYTIAQAYVYNHRFVYTTDAIPGKLIGLDGMMYDAPQLLEDAVYLGEGVDSETNDIYSFQMERGDGTYQLREDFVMAAEVDYIIGTNTTTGEETKIETFYVREQPIIFGNYILINGVEDVLDPSKRSIRIFKFDGSFEKMVTEWLEVG